MRKLACLVPGRRASTPNEMRETVFTCVFPQLHCSLCDRLSPSADGPMPLSCLHHGNDLYKWRSASHGHGGTGSRSTTACGRDRNDTEVSRVPRLSCERCPEPAMLDRSI